MPAVPLPPVTLVGFPFRTTGRGEHIRAVHSALTAAGVAARIYDLEPFEPKTDSLLQRQLAASLTTTVPPGIRLFHLNGDEIPVYLPELGRRKSGDFAAGYNIAFPAWELPRYPAPWARDLERFDEVWAASEFVHGSIHAAVNRPVLRMTNACEPHVTTPLDRRYFGIPADRYAILFFFDFYSYSARKNPQAVIETYRRLLAARPDACVQLILKLNHSFHNRSAAAEIAAAAAQFGDRVTVIDVTLTENEARNLVRCCDCFLSLHRSEGFGRGPAEAMFFGKPVVATGWSGNMEYMRPDNSFPVRFNLIPVGANEYPFPQDQVWADADVAHAAELLIRLVDDPEQGKDVGERARAHMLANFSDAVLGARYRARFEDIAWSDGLRAKSS
jgi:glycosyltransferase involved in cell wall biosynthesis